MSKHLTAGIDVGSSSVKAAIVTSDGGDNGVIVATAMQRIRRRNIGDVVRATFEEACDTAGVKKDAFAYIASTGDGEELPFATGHFYGMTSHARGALFSDPEARAALDIGALHARAIRMDERGKVLGHRMTSQCASGTGQFLENIARYLGVPIDDVGRLSKESTHTEEVSGVCAVLAETDVINMVSRGLGAGDILRGIHISIAQRLVRLLRSAGAEGVVALTGGLAYNDGLTEVLAEACRVVSPESAGKKRLVAAASIELRSNANAGLAGALGAALLGAYRFVQLEKKGRVEAVASLPS